MTEYNKNRYLLSIVKFIEKSNKTVTLSQVKDLLMRMYNFDLRETKYIRFKPFIEETFGTKLKISNDDKSIVSLRDKEI